MRIFEKCVTFWLPTVVNYETEYIKEVNVYFNDLSVIQQLNCIYTFVPICTCMYTLVLLLFRDWFRWFVCCSLAPRTYKSETLLSIEVGESGPEWGDREKGGSLFRSPSALSLVDTITRSYKTQFQTNFKSESKIQTHLQL